MQKNYHQILGVAADASPAAIKLAFRRLAHRYHPDISSETNASEKFAEITEAYKILHAQHILKTNKHKVQNAAQSDKTATAKTDCHLTAHLSVEELYWGVELKLNPAAQCPGRRSARTPPRLLNVKIRRGTQPGQHLRIKNGADDAVDLTIAVKRHERYDIIGNQLYVDLPLSPWEAKNGAIMDVVTPGGRVEVDVPAAISSGQTIRIPGRGLPTSAAAAGDLFAVARLVRVDERTRRSQKWPHVAHKEAKRWRAVGEHRGNTIDTVV